MSLHTCAAAVAPEEVPNHHIGRLSQIEASFGQACDDAYLPSVSGSPPATENQSKVVSHLRVRRTSR
jgi:hypothetical protein